MKFLKRLTSNHCVITICLAVAGILQLCDRSITSTVPRFTYL